jgi:sugar phosphate isomerase/epimerase
MLAYAAPSAQKALALRADVASSSREGERSEDAGLRLLSLAHLTVLDADPLALIDAAAAGGFDAVGLRIVPALRRSARSPMWSATPICSAGSRQRLTETGLKILDVEAIWLKPETRIEALKPALGTGAELGAKYVLTIALDDDRARLSDNFGKLCAAGYACGLRTMLEFIPYSVLGTLREAHAFLTEAAPQDAGLLVDALHLSRSGGHPSDIAAYDPALFSYIHLCDAPQAKPAPEKNRDEARGNRLYPGDGELWLDAFVAAFPPDTPIAVEAPNAATRNLPITERARLAGEATRRLLRS